MYIKDKTVMNKRERIFYLTLLIIGVYCVALFAKFWFSFANIPNNFAGNLHFLDFFLFGGLSLAVWYQVVMELHSWDIAWSMKEPLSLEPGKGLKVAFLTAFVPKKESYIVLERALNAIKAVKYPHHSWLLDEGNDEYVKELCKKYNVKYFSRFGIDKYNLESGKYKTKTKSGNYNAWFDTHGSKYDIIAQHDVDFTPKQNFLTETLGYFKDPRVAFVGTPQLYANQNESWIARGAAEQTYIFNGHIQKGFYGNEMPLLIGANHLIRVTALKEIDGYAPHIVEDHLTGMNFYTRKWKSVYIPKALAFGEGPATWEAYFNQQMRWSYGLFHILFTKSPKMLWKMRLRHIYHYLILQQFYFYGLAQGIGVLLLFLYFVFGFQATQLKLLPLLIGYLPLILVQIEIAAWLQRFYIDPKNEGKLQLRGRILNIAVWPIYLVAFLSVIVGKRLNYKVTPKGLNQKPSLNLFVFLPHFILGTISAICIVAYFITPHKAWHLLLLAILNTIYMYGLIIWAGYEKLKSKNIIFSQKQSFLLTS